MTEPCSDLVPFADGELEPARADAFRRHLRACATCQAELVVAMQLSARLSMLGLATEAASPVTAGDEAVGSQVSARPTRAATEDEPVGALSPAGVLIVTAPGIDDANTASEDDVMAMRAAREQALTSPGLLATVRSIGSRRTRWLGSAAGALAAAAAVVLVVRTDSTPPLPQIVSVAPAPPESVTQPPPPPVVSEEAKQALASSTTRPYDVRVAYGGATEHRRLKTATRGPRDPDAPPTPYELLDKLDKRADRYGVTMVEAWFSGQPDKAITQLKTLPPSLEVRSNLAAFEGLRTSNDNIEPVLAELETLVASGDGAPARAARWNQAVLLERLELPRSAAAAFRKIVADGERGWADEARARAEQAERAAANAEQRWKAAHDEGDAMWRTGVPVSEAALRDAPGTVRAYLYYAVRSAPSADRVRALASVAAELDKIDGEPTLARYVERVAKLDFRRRAPLAAIYARAMKSEAITDAERRLLTASTPAPEVEDIVLGAMFDLDTAPRQLAAFRTLASATGDPWFEIVLALVEATLDEQRGDWLGAEVRLARAAERCTEGVAYQCIELARRRGHVYQQLHRVPDAFEVVKAGIALAQRNHEWERYRQLLVLLADIERFNRSTATARAYAGEVLLLMGPAPCDQRASRDRAVIGAAHQAIAGAALLDVNGPAARSAFDEAIQCAAPDLSAASSFADIGRLDPRPDDLPRLRAWLAPIRASKTLPPADRIYADTIEGRLQLESEAADERAAGAALLEQAITAAEALRGTMMAEKARAAAYSVLIFDDVYRHGHARALARFARELGIPMATRCVVGMSAEDERAVVVVRGADGQDHATYRTKRRTGAEAQLVPDELVTRLAGCAQVQVIARTELQGQPRVLPADLAWSYVTGAHRRTAPASRSPRSLVITNVRTPPALRLATLQTVPAVADTTLSGPSATPSLVLAKMRDATEIQFHTHALVDAGVSDASHLVLSPEPDGRYALTAEAIRSTTLRGQPIVVLAACSSAQGARYQHAPWSLPGAFLAAGAHAVFAAATDIPDRESGAFFDGVLARVRAGEDPATALRDVRLPILKVDPQHWVGDVLLFE